MSKNSSEYLINRKDNQYEVVIGLEVHAQVLSESKLFSTYRMVMIERVLDNPDPGKGFEYPESFSL